MSVISTDLLGEGEVELLDLAELVLQPSLREKRRKNYMIPIFSEAVESFRWRLIHVVGTHHMNQSHIVFYFVINYLILINNYVIFNRYIS